VLTASDPKAAKIPASVTVPAGRTSVAFTVQGNGVSVPKIVILGASHNGAATAASLTVAPGDKLSSLSATFSKSTRMLTITASDSNPQAVLAATLASNNQALGTMTNQGGSSFMLQLPFLSGTPASINVSSNLGAKAGQGVQLVP
jgi:hypothetical protein